MHQAQSERISIMFVLTRITVNCKLVKGELHLKPNLTIFCVLSGGGGGEGTDLEKG